MAYNVFISRVSNSDKKIKNSLSQRSSLGMGAYIFREVFISELDQHAYRVFDKKKTPDEILFKGLLLPKEVPNEVLGKILDIEHPNVGCLNDIFKNVPDNAKWKNHYFIDDNKSVVRFLEESDRHIKALENSQYQGNERAAKNRLYHSYVITLPIAKLQFPRVMDITRDDLKPIMYSVILEMIHEHFLSKGQAVLFGFHLSSEDEKVHVHLQVPTRTFSYYYKQKNLAFNHDYFIEWIKKNKLSRAKIAKTNNRLRFLEWKAKFEKDPSDYNRDRLNNFIQRFKDAEEMLDGIISIITQDLKSGRIFEKLKYDYMYPKETKTNHRLKDDSYFSDKKGFVELHQDSYFFLDQIKKTYSDLLNKYLSDMGIIYKGEKLYDYVPSSPNHITISEMKRWDISLEERARINKRVNEIFKFDNEFFYKETPWIQNEKIWKKRHLLTHGLKSELKKEYNERKESFARDFNKVESWVSSWLNRLEVYKQNYVKLLEKAFNPKIFVLDWKIHIKNTLHLFWEEFIVEQSIPDDYEVFDVDFEQETEKPQMSFQEVVDIIEESKVSDDSDKPEFIFEKTDHCEKAHSSAEEQIFEDNEAYVDEEDEINLESEYTSLLERISNMTEASKGKYLDDLSDEDVLNQFQILAKDMNYETTIFEDGYIAVNFETEQFSGTLNLADIYKILSSCYFNKTLFQDELNEYVNQQDEREMER